MRVTKEEFKGAWGRYKYAGFAHPTVADMGPEGFHYCHCWEKCRNNFSEMVGCCIVLFLCENGFYEYDNTKRRSVTGVTEKGKKILPLLEKAESDFEIDMILLGGNDASS